jgi:hypothetical protein
MYNSTPLESIAASLSYMTNNKIVLNDGKNNNNMSTLNSEYDENRPENTRDDVISSISLSSGRGMFPLPQGYTNIILYSTYHHYICVKL